MTDELDEILDWLRYMAEGWELDAGGDGSKTKEKFAEAKAKINSIMISRAEVREAIGKKEPYVELDYSKYENDDDTPYSKHQIKDSRKQRMQRVVNRNQLRSELLKGLGL